MKEYLKELNKKFFYRANWEPTKPIRIGDIGKIEKGVFSVYSNLEKQGIPMEVRIAENQGNLEYNSSGGVKISKKLSGETSQAVSHLSEGDAGIVVEFNKDRSIAFKANGTKIEMLENLGEIEQAVKAKFKNDEWPKEWVIISELVTADEATILISKSSNAKLELKANAKIGAGEQLDLANGSLELSPQMSQGISTQIIAKEGLSPLYRAAGIKKSWWSGTGFGNKGIGDEDAREAADLFEDVAFDESELEDE